MHPRRTGRPSIMRLLLILVLVAVTACTPDQPAEDPLLDLVGRVPAELAAAGLYATVDLADHARLLAALGIEADQVVAVGETSAPALRVFTGSGFAAVGDRLRDLGFSSSSGSGNGAGDWITFERPADVEGFVGIPAVAVGQGVGSDVSGVRDVVAVGDLQQLAMVEQDDGGLPLDTDVLIGFESALVGRRDDVAMAMTSRQDPDEAEEIGTVLMRHPTVVEQSVAVDAAVRLRILAAESAEPAWTVGAPLATEMDVTVPLTWVRDAPEYLRAGLGEDLLGQVAQEN